MKSLHMSKKDKLKAIILIILTLCVVAFIFMHSLTPATLSAEESGAVTDWLTNLIPFQLTDHIVRKMAHFTEYSVLGFLTSFTVYSFFKKAIIMEASGTNYQAEKRFTILGIALLAFRVECRTIIIRAIFSHVVLPPNIVR